MKEIAIDESILKYTEQLYPLIVKMKFFVSMQQQLYDAFSSYQGEAKKEIDEYADMQLRQLTLMCEGYDALTNNLVEIINAFQITDDAAKKRIETFMNNLDTSLNTESERMKAVLDSSG